MPLSPLASWSEQPLDIVVVEDHALVRDELVEFLTRPGITVRGVDDGLALDAALRQRHADILVVDLNLPAEDGLSICQRMRKAFPEMGLILLTARVMPSDKAAGYQSGADVYLTKPANVDELEAVVFNLSRRIRRRVGNGLQLDMPQLRLSRGPGSPYACRCWRRACCTSWPWRPSASCPPTVCCCAWTPWTARSCGTTCP
jgi:DNA-binding response OmpR family regulator